MTDPQRQRSISELLDGSSKGGGVQDVDYAKLVGFGKDLNDYGNSISNNDTTAATGTGGGGASSKRGGTDSNTLNNNNAMDEDMGVAVVFDDSDDSDAAANNEENGGGANNHDDEEVDVVVSSSDESDDGDHDDADDNDMKDDGDIENDKDDMNNMEDDNDETLLVQGDGTTSTTNKKKSSSSLSKNTRILSVHEIDAHYLQRRLSPHYTDADICKTVADDVLNILEPPSFAFYSGASSSASEEQKKTSEAETIRTCENKLLILLDSPTTNLFHFIKLVLNNRIRIWGCIRLKRISNQKERDVLENLLRNEDSGEGLNVLEELSGRSNSGSQKVGGIGDGAGIIAGGSSTIKNKKDSAERRRGVSSALDSIQVTTKKDEDGNDIIINDDTTSTSTTINSKNETIELDLDSLSFHEGSHTMSNKKCELPPKTWRAIKPGYEEVHVPAVKGVMSPTEKLIPIKDLPKWTHDAFQGMDKLNRIQSQMCDIALKSSENLLLCAPTGAGKTNVAMLTMLNILGQYRISKNKNKKNVHDMDDEDDEDEANNEDMYDLNSFKIIYVAPMKALVQEVVKNFSKRLQPYGVIVKELSGDSSLSRHDLSQTQILVTTPEKWDVVTRNGEGRAHVQLVRLVIIDEIHLLHDDRGPVLESIVSRIVRQVERNAEPVRLVGLSATLPNHGDVATFLRVKPNKGLFHFDHTYRPVPLQMQYIGVTERNAFRRHKLQNEICYNKIVGQRTNGASNTQILVFVHSRVETGRTAKALRDTAAEKDESSLFVREGGATEEILAEELPSVKDAALREVLRHGFAIHHAGMCRADRELVEDLFADGHIAVLCCTATLAWGVNLPAHCVIIKGTEIYDPTKGKWRELGPLDVLQMLGRAGRPQYDSEGEGVVITAHSELQYYLSLTNLQLPVESQMIKSLPDHLNAEIVLGNVCTIKDAADWIGYTFLYVRMLQNPTLYGIMNPEQTLKDDPTLKGRRMDLAHTASCILERNGLIRYDRRIGTIRATPMGRIASRYYISHPSMAMYSRHLRPNMSDIELLRLFAMSGEFAHVTVREEEKLELSKLAARVPIPIKEGHGEPSAKINVLLQSYMSRLKLDGFALVSDMAFIRQSAARIMRALFEMSLKRGWSSLARLTLDFANMVSGRTWRSQSPLRQFGNVPDVVTRKLERKGDVTWDRYFDLTPLDLGDLVGVPKMGRTLHKLVHRFPRLELSAQVQPITRSMLRVELSILPDFEYDVKVHGYVQLFHIITEDVNGNTVLHHETFALKSSEADDEHVVVFMVPILNPLPPLYFVRVVSDRWLHSESTIPVSFSGMILPPKLPPSTELLDLQPLPPSALGEPALVALYKGIKDFNPIQTQTFHELFKTDRNALVCAPSGSGKTICAEFAILRMLVSNPKGKCLYVAPKDDIALSIHNDWSKRFKSILTNTQISILTGDTVSNLKKITESKIVVCTVRQWDAISRRWKQRKPVQAISLVIFDEIHFLVGEGGPMLEVIISRMRYISSQRKEEGVGGGVLRIIGLSASLANARELGEWMGVPNKCLFNFSPKVRPTPLEIYIQSFDQGAFSARLLAMSKPVYDAIARHSDRKPTLVFVPSRRQAQLTAIDIMAYHESLGGNDNNVVADGSSSENNVTNFLGKDATVEDITSAAERLKESALRQVITSGVGFVHGGMVESDFNLVTSLYHNGVINVLVCPFDLCWKVKEIAHLVVIMGTETFDGKEKRYEDYPVADMLHMMGRASRHLIDASGKCVILCHTPKKEHLKKLLYDPLPIESHLDHYLHDHFNSEIVTKTIGNMQDAVDYITWTFLYRRLTKNPNYYNLQGTSNVQLSEHMSEMVETVLGDLEQSKCCQMNDEGNVSPLNLGMIAAYYYIQYTTIELIASSVTSKTKTRGIMEILSASSEFSSLSIRHGEEKSLRILARKLKYSPPESARFHDANTKALVLLQCHFSRNSLTADMRKDQENILVDSVNLIQAIVDVISSNGWLRPALAAMELSQMILQGLWNKDNILLQIPHFTNEIIQRCETHKGEDGAIDSVFDILALEDDVRDDLLRLPEEKMSDVAVFCNSYPNIDVSFKVQDIDTISAGEPVKIVIKLEREMDEEDEEEMDEEEIAQIGVVSARLFPKEKREGWWVVVGDTKENVLLSLKRVGLQRSQTVSMEFLAPEEPGDYDLTLFCMSDSYLGCDQEYAIPLSVGAACDSDDDGSSSESSNDSVE